MSLPPPSVPQYTPEEVSGVLQKHFGIKAQVKALDSYDDQNFHVRDTQGNEFVFKISHATEQRAFLEAQHQALAILNRGDLAGSVPKPVPDTAGDEIFIMPEKEPHRHWARMLTYLPGGILGQHSPHSAVLRRQWGGLMGNIDRALEGFFHPALQRYYEWDLQHALDLQRDSGYIRDPRRRSLAAYFLLQFETEVLPQLPGLRRSVIHSDGNDYNLLTGSSADRSAHISGIIDFGDMVYSCTVCEAAIAAAYALLDQPDPLAAAAELVAGYHSAAPLQEAEVDLLFYLICARLCASVIISSRELALHPENDYIAISQRPAWQALEKLLPVNPLRAAAAFRKACGFPAENPPPAPRDLLAERRRYIGKSLSISYRRPLHIVRGAMQYLFEADGETYLDCVNNVCHVGHCHPRVVRAAQRQLARLNTNTRYLHDHLSEYARQLTATLPEPLEVCFFTNSGTEANDLALRLARAYTGQQDVIVLEGAYHGHSTAVIEISPYKFDGPGGAGARPYIHKAPMPDPYRGRYRSPDPAIGEQYAAGVEQIIRQLQQQGRAPAAFFCEPLLSCGGQIVLPEGYLAAAFAQVRRAGGLCVADEVQVGFGRIGTHFWAFQHQGVVPEILTLGKPIGNGHPLAAVITTRAVADAFANGMEYFNTFGGNPVSCAVGLAVLETIREEGLQENAREVGAYFLECLRDLQRRHPAIGDVRGLGLFLGIELVADPGERIPDGALAGRIVEAMKQRGILLSTDGPDHNVIKIKPPLVFSRKNVDLVCENLDEAIC